MHGEDGMPAAMREHVNKTFLPDSMIIMVFPTTKAVHVMERVFFGWNKAGLIVCVVI